MIFSGHVCIAYALKTSSWISGRIRAYAIRPYMSWIFILEPLQTNISESADSLM